MLIHIFHVHQISAVVHNGIIENYQELKEQLSNEGHIFKSQTDSEVIPHLLEKYCKEFDNEYNKTLIETCKSLRGSFAFVAIFKNGLICGARFDEPLIIGIGSRCSFLIKRRSWVFKTYR